MNQLMFRQQSGPLTRESQVTFMGGDPYLFEFT